MTVGIGIYYYRQSRNGDDDKEGDQSGKKTGQSQNSAETQPPEDADAADS